MLNVQNDTHILHSYYFTEIILFLIIKVGEQAWRTPGHGDPGIPGSPLAILRYSAIICNFLMIFYLYLRHGRRLRLFYSHPYLFCNRQSGLRDCRFSGLDLLSSVTGTFAPQLSSVIVPPL